MAYEIVLTDSQESGLAVKLQEENTRRLRPVQFRGRPVKLKQITTAEFVQAVIEDIAEQGVLQLQQLADAEFVARVKVAMDNPETRKLIEDYLKIAGSIRS